MRNVQGLTPFFIVQNLKSSTEYSIQEEQRHTKKPGACFFFKSPCKVLTGFAVKALLWKCGCLGTKRTWQMDAESSSSYFF